MAAIGADPGTLRVYGNVDDQPTPEDLQNGSLALVSPGDAANSNTLESPNEELSAYLQDLGSFGITDRSCAKGIYFVTQEMQIEYWARGTQECKNPKLHVQLLASYGMDLLSRSECLKELRLDWIGNQQAKLKDESSYDAAVLVQTWQISYLYDPLNPRWVGKLDG